MCYKVIKSKTKKTKKTFVYIPPLPFQIPRNHPAPVPVKRKGVTGPDALLSGQRGPFIHRTECSALLPTPRIVIDCQVYKTGQYKHDAKLTHMTEPIVSISLSFPGSPLSFSFCQAIEAYRRLLLTILTYKAFYL